MDYDYNDRKQGSVYSRRLKAGKRRTYYFDVRETKGNDFFVTITESRKRFNEDGFERHKIHLYKEDFNKFVEALGGAVDYVKTELMPDFDFDYFNHDQEHKEEPRLRQPQSRDQSVSDTPSDGGIADADPQANINYPHNSSSYSNNYNALDIDSDKRGEKEEALAEVQEETSNLKQITSVDREEIENEIPAVNQPLGADQTTETEINNDKTLINQAVESENLASEEVEKW